MAVKVWAKVESIQVNNADNSYSENRFEVIVGNNDGIRNGVTEYFPMSASGVTVNAAIDALAREIAENELGVEWELGDTVRLLRGVDWSLL